MRLKKSVISLLVLAAIVLSPFLSLHFDSPVKVAEAFNSIDEFNLPFDQRFGFIGTEQRTDSSLLDRFYYYYDPSFGTTDPQQWVKMVDHHNGKVYESDYDIITDAAQVPSYSYWLIGNEPNGTDNITADAYAELTHKWYVKLHNLNANAQIYVGQTAYFDQTYLEAWWSYYTNHWGTPPFNGYTVHAYSFSEAGNPNYPKYGVQTVARSVEKMRVWMHNHGLDSKPLWLTEYGELEGHAGSTHPAPLGSSDWTSQRDYMRRVNSWLVSHTDKVQRWFWFADNTVDGSNCWTGDLYHHETSSCFSPADTSGTRTVLGDEYINYSEAVGASTSRGYLPIVMKNDPGWNTDTRVRNNDTAARYVTMIYYDTNGKGISGDIAYVPAGGYADFSQYDNPYPAHDPPYNQFTSFTGSAKILSQGAVAAEVNELRTTGGDSMAYTGMSSGSTTVYAQAIMYNAAGSWTTGIAVMNTGTANASVTIRYYNSAGTQVGNTETNNSLAANAYWGVFNGSGGNSGLPAGFVGTAKITSTQPIAVVINNIDYGSSLGALANEGTGGANTIYLPITQKNAYGGWYTMIYVRNDDTVSRAITVKYYNSSGAQVASEAATVSVGGYAGLAQQSTPGLPDGFAGSAVVTSSGPVTAVVTEWNNLGPVMAYTGLPAGGTTVFNVPIMYNGGGTWTTGLAVINAGAAAASVSSSYFNENGNPAGNVDTYSSLPVKAYWAFSNAGSSLPPGFIGTGKVTSLQPMGVVIHNIDSGGAGALAYTGWQ